MARWGCSDDRTAGCSRECAPAWPTSWAAHCWRCAAFTAAALAGGIGAVAYLLLWLLAPAAAADPGAPPLPRGAVIAAGLLATGLVWWVLDPATAAMLAAAAGGAALIWWTPARTEDARTEHAPTEHARTENAPTEHAPPEDASTHDASTHDAPEPGLLRRSAGIGLLALAAVGFLARQVGLSLLTATIGAVAVILGGAALVASPFIVRLVRDRDRERAEQLAVRQRAEIAAHLHDSVLQTLSLIQREHTDPATVLRLARAEERGLRNWLYGQQADPGQPRGLADQLQDAAAAVEQSEAALIEVVTVGELTALTPATEAVVAATREAMLNAARHARDPQPIQVFARISPDEAAVFIRDRGCGFDPDALPADRGGVRDSIAGRITRAGGTTTIRSAPGAGTEIQIRMPL